jgi:hypothetical protein
MSTTQYKNIFNLNEDGFYDELLKIKNYDVDSEVQVGGYDTDNDDMFFNNLLKIKNYDDPEIYNLDGGAYNNNNNNEDMNKFLNKLFEPFNE